MGSTITHNKLTLTHNEPHCIMRLAGSSGVWRNAVQGVWHHPLILTGVE